MNSTSGTVDLHPHPSQIQMPTVQVVHWHIHKGGDIDHEHEAEGSQVDEPEEDGTDQG